MVGIGQRCPTTKSNPLKRRCLGLRESGDLTMTFPVF